MFRRSNFIIWCLITLLMILNSHQKKFLVTKNLPEFSDLLSTYNIEHLEDVFSSMNIFETQYILRLTSMDFNIMVSGFINVNLIV